MVKTKRFTKKYLVETLDIGNNMVQNNLISTGSFTKSYRCVFRDTDNKYYCGYYYLPLDAIETPENINSCIVVNNSEMICEEVRLKEIVTKQWENVTDENENETHDELFNIRLTPENIDKLKFMTNVDFDNNSHLDRNTLVSVALNLIIDHIQDIDIDKKDK